MDIERRLRVVSVCLAGTVVIAIAAIIFTFTRSTSAEPTAGTSLPISKGGTGAVNALDARTNLGIGTTGTLNLNSETTLTNSATNFPTSSAVTAALANKQAVTLLWSGSFGSGTITVPDITNYRFLFVSVANSSSSDLMAASGTIYDFKGRYYASSSQNDIYNWRVLVNRSGDNLTFVRSGYIAIGGAGTVPTYTNYNYIIYAIYGIK